MVRTRNSSAAAAATAIKREDKAQLERDELDQLEAAATAAAEAAVAADAAMDTFDVAAATAASAATLGLPKEEEYGDEAELTNLTWLQSLNIMSASGLPTPPCSPAPLIMLKAPPAPRQQPKKLTPLQKAQIDMAAHGNEYLTDPHKKPPYSYATLICLAMRANDNKITLSNIYAWIRENFAFYQTADPTWQNSIRHNLSLNKCFVKLPRTKGEPGKGGFWKLDLERLEEGRRTKRRTSVYKRARNPPKRTVFDKVAQSVKARVTDQKKSTISVDDMETDHVAKILGRDASMAKCIVLYETPPSSVSPPIPSEPLGDSNQVDITEDEFSDLLISSVDSWDPETDTEIIVDEMSVPDDNHLALLDSLLAKL